MFFLIISTTESRIPERNLKDKSMHKFLFFKKIRMSLYQDQQHLKTSLEIVFYILQYFATLIKVLNNVLV